MIETWKIELNRHSFLIGKLLGDIFPISKKYIDANSQKSEIGFNIFTIASDLYYRENFHSYIIKSFLDPNESHKENSKYLNLFIKMLNKFKDKTPIEIHDFQLVNVVRERSNVDILIADELSRKAILIENKINNAVDQERQLPKYFDAISQNYEVVGIIYLTLNFAKRPDKSDWSKEDIENVKPLIRLIPAFDPRGEKISLYDDWIVPSIVQSHNIDSALLLRQYGKLIKYLNTNTMDTVSLDKFYSAIKEKDNLQTAISIRNMLNDLPEYLAIRIEDKYVTNCFPFEKVWRYKGRDAVFEGCKIEEYYIKIDVWCDEKGYTIHFWDKEGLDIIEDFKNKIEVLSDFEIYGEGTSNIKKRFEGLQEEKVFSFIDEIKNELKKRKKTATNKA
jgi:PD-(D/E)XK nuclease superfamily